MDPETKARLNWSTLKYLAVSPKLLQWRVEQPRPDTPALQLGRAIHCMVLEPDEFASRWISATVCEGVTKTGNPCTSIGSLYFEGSWFCKKSGHAPDLAGPPPQGIEVIASDERERVQFCADSVHAHEPAMALLSGGKSEQSLTWEDKETGIACRGRLDYISSFITDLKSTRKETIREFTLDAARNMYHGQLAWYHDGAIVTGRIPDNADRPCVVSVSTAEPYDVAPFRLSEATLEAGRALYRDLLKKYAHCQSAGWWPGIAPDMIELDLPDWAPGMQGSEESDEW